MDRNLLYKLFLIFFVIQACCAKKKSAKSGPGDADSCYSFGDGSVYPESGVAKSNHQLQYTKALIQKPAPAFYGTAVVDGEFTSLSLSDYLGKYVVFFFLSNGFYICLSH